MIQTISEHCEKIPGLVAVYLFGSFADGSHTEESDLDLAFLATEPFDNLKRWDLSQEMAITLGIDVDLVDFTNCSEVMRVQILSSGNLIFSKDDKKFNDFADRCFWLYLDLQDLRAEQYQDIKNRKTVYG